MKQRHHLITGFPGFIGRRLVAKLLETQPRDTFVCLVERRLLERSENTLSALRREHPDLDTRLTLICGDITQHDLGLDHLTWEHLIATVETVWHLAAVYDLSIAEEVAYRINVTGTTRILEFCEAADRFKRLNYVSTCYVAGDRKGLVTESELDLGQEHKNHYESTKFWAEIEVQKRMARLDTAIFRPAIVVGDSTDGTTDKYDGPYFLIRAMMRSPRWLRLPRVGAGEARVNLVPVDFVVDAMVAIADQDDAGGRVYQLADPNPMRARDLIDELTKILDRRMPIGSVSPRLVTRLLSVPSIRRAVGIPAEAVTYFNHPVQYDVTNTLTALLGTTIRCPHASTYLRRMVDYVYRNPNKFFLDGRRL